MREINVKEISGAVSRLFQEASFFLPDDVLASLMGARGLEESVVGRGVIDKILENTRIAVSERVPLCQDCGVAIVFLEVGQEVHITGGEIYKAVNEGVSQSYREGYLRKSMVRQPFSSRINTGDNTPAVIHADIVPGDRLKITVMPKGAGSENMTGLCMLTPSAGRQGIIDFVVDSVSKSGGNPCPPVILGVGVGGTSEKTLMLSKIALLRRVGEPSPDAEVAGLERDILRRVNNLGIGPMGYGGRITALSVHAEVFPAHIGSLPVAVNLQCHCARHRSAVL